MLTRLALSPRRSSVGSVYATDFRVSTMAVASSIATEVRVCLVCRSLWLAENIKESYTHPHIQYTAGMPSGRCLKRRCTQ